jgi:signal transduction histidine kinase
MSHELRTPLNSILILGQQLAENNGGNLSTKQVDFAKNIHSAGTDLLTLINDILDLSKIESAPSQSRRKTSPSTPSANRFLRSFHHVAESKSLSFQLDIDNTLPRSFTSDPKRLQQILKNLLSNAFKFTSQGQVSMRVQAVTSGWSPDRTVHPDDRSRMEEATITALETGSYESQYRAVRPDGGVVWITERGRLFFDAEGTASSASAGTSRPNTTPRRNGSGC